MDGLQTPQMPQIPGGGVPTQPQIPTAPGGPGYYVPPTQPPPPGDKRSHAPDPERSAAAKAAAEEKRRLAELLPKAATDSRIAIRRSKGAELSLTGRPALLILLSDIEDARQSGMEANEYIQSRLADRFPRGGRFTAVAQNRQGRPIPDVAPWQIEVDGDDLDSLKEQEGEDEEEEEFEELPIYDEHHHTGYAPNMHMMQTPGYDPRFPPPPPQPQAAQSNTTADAVKAMVEVMGNGRQDNSLVALMMQMDQQRRADDQARMQLQLQIEEKREAERREEKKLEEERREKKEREDRERSDKRWQAIMAALPAGLTVLVEFFKGRQSQGDVMMPLLLKMIDSSQDRSAMKDMMGLTNEAAKQQMALQGESMKSLMSSQGELNAAMLQNALGMMTKLASSYVEASGGETDDFLGKVQKVMGLAQPILEGMRNQSQAVPQPGMPQVAPAAMQAVGAPTQAKQQVRNVLAVLRAMESGDDNHLSPQQRLQDLVWISNTLPDAMKQAVVAGNEQGVIQAAAPAIVDDVEMMEWIGDEHVQGFVRTTLGQVGGILRGETSDQQAQEVLQYHHEYLGRHHRVGLEGVPVQAPSEEETETEAEGESDAEQETSSRFTHGQTVRVLDGPRAGQTGQVSMVLDGGYAVRFDDGVEEAQRPHMLEAVVSAPARRAPPPPPPPVPEGITQPEERPIEEEEGEE